MEVVTHREMRNRSGDILRRVQAGESFLVSNHGQPAAVIGPPPSGSALDELLRRGDARAALTDASVLGTVKAATSVASTREILDDVRGKW